MKYYKVKLGFKESQYLSITQEELPKALMMFLTQTGRGVFSDGNAIRASDILRIEPDWHKEMGWNKGWEMTPDDYAEVRPFEKAYMNTFKKAKDIVEKLIQTNQTNLSSLPLSKLMDMNLLPEIHVTPVTKAVETLADKMKLK